MAIYPIKPDPNRGVYVLWDTDTDTPISRGTKRHVGEDMFRKWAVDVRDQIEAAFDRADETADHRPEYAYMTISSGPGAPGILPFHRLNLYAANIQAGEVDKAAGLVDDLPDRLGDLP